MISRGTFINSDQYGGCLGCLIYEKNTQSIDGIFLYLGESSSAGDGNFL